MREWRGPHLPRQVRHPAKRAGRRSPQRGLTTVLSGVKGQHSKLRRVAGCRALAESAIAELASQQDQ